MNDRAIVNTSATQSRRGRWLPRFGLRTLLVVLLVAAVPMGLAGRRLHHARQQAAAVEFIESRRGNVVYDFQLSGRDIEQSPWAARLPFLGTTFFHQVWEVNVSLPQGAEISSKESERLKAQLSRSILSFPQLKALTIAGHDCDPKLLADLRQRNSLKMLTLDCSTDSHCDEIRGISSLRHLRIDMSQTTTASLEAVSEMYNLRSLFLDSLTNKHDLSSLKSMDNLESLRIWHSDLRSSNFQKVATQPKLKEVTLEALCDSSAALAWIGEHSKLREVKLYCEGAPANTLMVLSNLKELRSLSLNRASITGDAFVDDSNWRNLTTLELKEPTFFGDSFNKIAALPTLHTLEIKTTPLPADVIASAPWTSALVSLQLESETRLTLSQLRMLPNLPHLRALYISDEDVHERFRSAQDPNYSEPILDEPASDSLE